MVEVDYFLDDTGSCKAVFAADFLWFPHGQVVSTLLYPFEVLIGDGVFHNFWNKSGLESFMFVMDFRQNSEL